MQIWAAMNGYDCAYGPHRFSGDTLMPINENEHWIAANNAYDEFIGSMRRKFGEPLRQ